jgi:SAM-dependent methyltransferase
MDNLAAYSTIPYPGQVTTQTHPDQIAVIARLLGVAAKDPNQSRILEIGCSDGGNLVPIAARLPGADCVGLDLVPDAIERARAYAAEAGVANATFLAADVMAPPADLGTFDVILCHGVWSWVPPAARDGILSLIRDHLAPNGVAYVSYNVWPGWGLRTPVRRMMQWHAREAATASETLSRARALAAFLADLPSHPRVIGSAIRAELAEIAHLEDWYLFHEYLATDNEPVFFHEFAKKAADHGLAYLGDAERTDLVPFDLPDEVQDGLADLASDRVSYEQYLDFVRERAFRRTLLVHAGIEADYGVTNERLSDLWAQGRVQLPSDWAEDDSLQAAALWAPGGPPRKADDVVGLVAASVVEKAAWRRLGEAWPAAVAIEALVAEAASEVGADAEEAGVVIRRRLLAAWLEGGVHLSCGPLPVGGTSPSELTRAEARKGRGWVTSARHHVVRIDAVQSWMLQRLDHDDVALAGELAGEIVRGALPAPDDLDGDVVGWVGRTRTLFADALLLVGPIPRPERPAAPKPRRSRKAR